MTATTRPSAAAMSQEAMVDRLSTFPDYRGAPQAPAVRHAQVVRTLWGAQLRPIMADASITGRFSGAALKCPATACTGAAEMEPQATSLPYRNPAAIENILCLDGKLEVRYGPALDKRVELGRFDMLSIPNDVKHALHNPTDGVARFVMVLSTGPSLDYSAVFQNGTAAEAAAPGDCEALAVTFDDAPGTDVESSVLEGRITRFEKLVPYKKDLKNTAGVPPEATEMLSARSVFPLIVPEGHIGRSRTAPMYGNQGLYMSIAECAGGGEDGPPPHAHSDTQESFFVLDGEWDISTGFDNEFTVVAKPYDIVAMPNKVMRAFQNRSDKTARLFVIIQGPERMNDTVSFSHRIGEEVERRFGKETIEAYERIRMTFDAEERLKA